jgi:hypothetical protein
VTRRVRDAESPEPDSKYLTSYLIVITDSFLQKVSIETSLDVLELAMDSLWDNKAFSKYIHRTREELIQQRTASRLWLGLRGHGILPGGGEMWYGDMPDGPYYVKLIGKPG